MIKHRIPALDYARTAALAGMVVYHFTYDLGLFGFIPLHTATTGGWAIFARIIAGSFLFLAGVSLYLAHGSNIRWPSFAYRAVQIGTSAALITTLTYFLHPDAYVFFGILHSILTASVIGLLFLRLPWFLTAAIAISIIWISIYCRADIFNAPPLLWIGLFTKPVTSIDYVPVFPWLAVFMAGLALAQLAVQNHFIDRSENTERPGKIASALAWPGKHSLIIYLVHQPILIGLLWLFTRFF